jgi:hypothetical protein
VNPPPYASPQQSKSTSLCQEEIYSPVRSKMTISAKLRGQTANHGASSWYSRDFRIGPPENTIPGADHPWQT